MLIEPDPAILAALLLAVLLDRWFGEPERVYAHLPHPVVMIGRAITAMDKTMRRPAGPPRANRRAGLVLLLVLIGGSALLAMGLSALARSLPGGWIIEALLISTLLAWGSLESHVARVRDALAIDLEEGRAAVAHIVGRDPDQLDESGVARAAIESLAENLSDGFTAPFLAALLFGLPGILVYKSINTADSMIGYKSERYRDFGRAAARTDDLVNLLPARLTGFAVIVAAALKGRRRTAETFRIMRACAPLHRSPNAGWPEAAMAGALDIRIAGPRRYAGELVFDHWMGEGRAELTSHDITRALELARTSHTLITSLCLVMALVLLVA